MDCLKFPTFPNVFKEDVLCAEFYSKKWLRGRLEWREFSLKSVKKAAFFM